MDSDSGNFPRLKEIREATSISTSLHTTHDTHAHDTCTNTNARRIRPKVVSAATPTAKIA